MECEDEELSPAQMKASKIAKEAYQKSVKEVAVAQAEAEAAALTYVPTPEPVPAPVTQTRGRKAPPPAPIIVDDPPPRKGKSRGRGKAATHADPPQPHPQLQSPIVNMGQRIMTGGANSLDGMQFQIIGTSPEGHPILARPAVYIHNYSHILHIYQAYRTSNFILT